MKIHHLRKQKRNHSRRGAALVEFAICAPVLFMIVFAAVEFSNANMFRNSAENAAYEGARRGIIPGATAQDAEDAARFILNAIGTQSATVNVSPNPITNSTETVTVDIEIPMSDNGWITPVFFGGYKIKRSCKMNREAVEVSSTP